MALMLLRGGQRFPVYWWLLLCAMVVSIASLYRLNLTPASFATTFDHDDGVPKDPHPHQQELKLPAVAALVVADRDLLGANPDIQITFDPSKVQQKQTVPLTQRTLDDNSAAPTANGHKDASAPLQTKAPTVTAQDDQKDSFTTQHEAITNDHADNDDNTEKEKKPLNIVLLYADDWSYNSLGMAGNAYVQTPRLDEMARHGIFFTHNCVVASVCMQSRATLYTGQYSSAHQTYFAYRNVTMYDEGKWNQTLYPLMKRAGYHVGFYGKYHHTEPPPRDVPAFDEFITTPFSHYVTRGGVTKHVTEWNEEDGMNFLHNKPADTPFFLTVSFFATHAEDGSVEQYRPMQSSMELYQEEDVPLPKTYTEEHWKRMPKFFDDRNVGRTRFRHRYSNHSQYQHHMKNTYRMVTEVDAACGRILDHLNATGQLDTTLVLFTTDNGNSHGQHGLAEKWYAYEESLRVPLIIHDPRSNDPTVISDFTLNIDLAPTILSAAGVPVPPVMQGTDMADLYLRNKKGRQEFLYEFWDDNPDIPNSVALVQKDFKYIYWNEHNYHQAFNLTNDPFEETDLFHEIPKNTYESVKQRISDLQSSTRSGSIQ